MSLMCHKMTLCHIDIKSIKNVIFRFFIMKKDHDIKKLVTKDNRLIEAHYKLTVQEQKLVLKVCSMVKQGDEDYQEYMIPVSEYKEIMGIKGERQTWLKQKAKALLKKPLAISRDHGGFLVINWFSSVETYPQEGRVGICFDPKLRPYLLDLKRNFTTFYLHNAAQLSSAYSIRLYELLKQYENTDTKRREFEFKELKKILGCEDRYKSYGDFNRRVLKPAQKELTEKTDIGFTFKVRKIGRRVNWIIFTIKPRKQAFVEDGQGGELDTADMYNPSDIPAEILKWIPADCLRHDVLRDIATYTETHGLPYVVQKAAYTAKHKPRDFAAYLGNALKKNLGAGFDPHQMEMFPEDSSLPRIAPGMRVVYEGSEYTLDQTECIWPESGGCMASGRIRELIAAGKIRIVEP